MTALPDYYDRLLNFDWSYHFSQSAQVYSAGSITEGRLFAISKESQQHKALYDGVREHFFTGPPFCREKKKLPARPTARLRLVASAS